jgi:hypothetical protein
MDFAQTIRPYATQPLTHQVLLSLLKAYKRPNAKLHALLHNGTLQSVRKGLYIAGPALQMNKPEPFLLANHIFGPSYISLETALSYHGLIPERVYEITSMTTKISRQFDTPMGLFSYTHLPLPYYSFGITQAKLSDQQWALVASPEKALCDKISATAGLLLRSLAQARAYLIESLRMEEQRVKALNSQVIISWLPDAPKKESLSILAKMIDKP